MYKVFAFLENTIAIFSVFSLLIVSGFIAYKINPQVNIEEGNVAGIQNNIVPKNTNLIIQNKFTSNNVKLEHTTQGDFQIYTFNFLSLNQSINQEFLEVINSTESDGALGFTLMVSNNLNNNLNIELKKDYDSIVLNEKENLLTFKSNSNSKILLKIDKKYNVNFPFTVQIIVK